jgi:antitoxin (DNA-binding transcriptional repressor) of toxin-antitoxin stability system
VDTALHGEPVEFTHKGQVIRLVPEQKSSKLSRLTPMQIVNPRTPDLKDAKRALLAEMEKEWTKDWDEQGL